MAILSALALAVCNSQVQYVAPLSNTVIISDLNNCRQVFVERGNVLEARMSTNTLVGDSWRVAYYNPSMMRPIGRPYFESCGPRYANYEVGSTVFRFQVEGYGADSIVLENVRPVAGQMVVSQTFVCLLYSGNPSGWSDCNLWFWNNNGIIDLRPKDCVYVRLPIDQSSSWYLSAVDTGPLHIVGQPYTERGPNGQLVQVFKFIGKRSGSQFIRFLNNGSGPNRSFEFQAQIRS